MGEKPFRQTNNKMDIHGEMLYEKACGPVIAINFMGRTQLKLKSGIHAMFLSIELILYASKSIPCRSKRER